MAIRINGDNTAAAPGITSNNDTDAGVHFGTDEVNLVTGGTVRATVDSSGNLGINNSAPADKLHVGGNIRYGTNTTYYGVIEHDAPTTGANIYTSKDTGGHIFKTGLTPSDKAQIDGAGQIQVGNNLTKTDVASTVAALVQTRFAGAFTNYSAIRESGPASFCFGRANGSGSQILSNNDEIGGIRWAGADGTDLETQAALIQCFVDGTPGSNNMPGRLKFSTSDGTNAPTERLKISSTGVFTTNGVQQHFARGASTGNSSFSRDFAIGATQSAIVIAAFNHYGLFGYGCTRITFASVGGSFSTDTIHHSNSGNGGSWAVSKHNNSTIRVTKNAGTHTGSGYWFIHVISS